MSKITSVSAGSSSLKFQLFEMSSEEVLTSGIVEKIGFEDVIFTIKVNGEKIKKVLPIPDYTRVASMPLEALMEYKVVNGLDEITSTGHRVVHGGEIPKESAPTVEDVVEELVSLSDLAPLHNPAGLVGHNTFKNNLPNCKHVSVLDTVFRPIMSKESYIYALLMKYYDKYKVHRYGFRGTNHKYMSLRCVELMNKKVEDMKIITCHLGDGANITTVDGGKSINTSMSFAPLAGVMMGTRCGDIDPTVVTYITRKAGATPDGMDDIMNMQSGMLDVSGISSDVRNIEDSCKEGDPATLLTAEVYINHVINVVDGYYAQFGSADTIVFVGGIGENDTNMRKMICDRLSMVFGIQLDEELNGKTRGKEVLLSTAKNKVAVRLIPTSEELMIARDTYRLIT